MIHTVFPLGLSIRVGEMVRLYHADIGSRLISATPSAHEAATASTEIVDTTKVAPLEPEKWSTA